MDEIKQPPTIRDVARAARVSVATASKALNDRGRMREETRANVRAAAERLGFRPNDLAQSLTRKRSFTVGLISTDPFGRFSMPVLEGIEEALSPARMSVFLCKASDNSALERQHVASLLGKRVDGIIVTGRRTDPRPPLDLGGVSLPLLYAYARVDDPTARCLLPDDLGGGRLAGTHLAGLGRRCIAHITGPERFEATQQRRDGLADALAAQGLPWRDDLVLSGPWSEEWGHEAVVALLDRRAPIDAIFCGSDQIGRGVADALRDRGVRVPDDIAVVGFDNWAIVAASTRPPLTTVDPNLHELGRQAGLRLLGLIGGEGGGDPGTARLRCHLVVRRSCGAHAIHNAAAGCTDKTMRP